MSVWNRIGEGVRFVRPQWHGPGIIHGFVQDGKFYRVVTKYVNKLGPLLGRLNSGINLNNSNYNLMSFLALGTTHLPKT